MNFRSHVNESPTVHLPQDFPQIVCLCGSVKFIEEYNQQRKRFTEEGYIVIGIECSTLEEARQVDPKQKQKLDLLHQKKIDLCDMVFIINKDGYVGDSTANEILYAKIKCKLIKYLETPK